MGLSQDSVCMVVCVCVWLFVCGGGGGKGNSHLGSGDRKDVGCGEIWDVELAVTGT